MRVSAGILLYKVAGGVTQFLLAHPGGPYFAKKNEGWWTIPKGEPLPDEDFFACALREFQEETGFVPAPPYLPLQPITQKGGKTVHAWAAESEFNTANLKCNTFEIEWPPRSGKMVSFPEIDRAEWFTYAQAVLMVNERQKHFIEELNEWIEVNKKGR